MTIAFFGHDSNESTVVKRGAAFLAQGCTVLGFMFRRPRPGLARIPAFPTIDLGLTSDRNYLRRMPVLAMGVGRALRHAGRLRRADVIYARNIDMLLVALTAKALALSRATVVYEVLDVQRPFLRSGVVGGVFRWVERQALRRCPLLVVSSPAFVEHYFGPRHRRRQGVFLLENKLGPASPPPAPLSRSVAPPWHVGWFGTLRCRRSFTLLCGLADILGDDVVVHLAGRPSPVDLTTREIEAAAAQRRNIVYHGAYDSPLDLPRLYGAMHFSWCIDYLDEGTNSAWLLPNRIYEGGRYGAVALARSDTETGRFVARQELGLTLDEPLDRSVLSALASLTSERYAAAAAKVAQLPAEVFVDTADTARLVKTIRELRKDRAVPAGRLDEGAAVARSAASDAEGPEGLQPPGRSA